MNDTVTARVAAGDRATKYGRYLVENAAASAAMAPQSTTRNSVQPNRKPTSGPYASRR